MTLANGLYPLIGGLLIGSAATLLLWSIGRIAGISNILAGVLHQSSGDGIWRWYFLAGLFFGGICLRLLQPEVFGPSPTSTGLLALAGLLVGCGSSLGNGCTSGHGVCGLSRKSLRSLVATLVFMFTAMVTVYFTQHVLAASQ